MIVAIDSIVEDDLKTLWSHKILVGRYFCLKSEIRARSGGGHIATSKVICSYKAFLLKSIHIPKVFNGLTFWGEYCLLRTLSPSLRATTSYVEIEGAPKPPSSLYLPFRPPNAKAKSRW